MTTYHNHIARILSAILCLSLVYFMSPALAQQKKSDPCESYVKDVDFHERDHKTKTDELEALKKKGAGDLQVIHMGTLSTVGYVLGWVSGGPTPAGVISSKAGQMLGLLSGWISGLAHHGLELKNQRGRVSRAKKRYERAVKDLKDCRKLHAPPPPVKPPL